MTWNDCWTRELKSLMAAKRRRRATRGTESRRGKSALSDSERIGTISEGEISRGDFPVISARVFAYSTISRSMEGIQREGSIQMERARSSRKTSSELYPNVASSFHTFFGC